jgi:uncharacterized protein YprB with RNaseH-like and TPR domain
LIIISRTFLHCPGIGPVRSDQLFELGFYDWQTVIDNPARLPFTEDMGAAIVEEAQRSQQALEARDLMYLADRLVSHDQWRIFGHFFEHASYFDIETTGLTAFDEISVICCYHKGELHTFMQDENLDDFLDLLEEVELLVSFNGASFDVPRVLDEFRIPELPCAHIDMRWLCYHAAYTGGLKAISQAMGFQRPAELEGLGGAEAVQLWDRWLDADDSEARELLIRYCAADVLLLPLVGARALLDKGYRNATAPEPAALWPLICPGQTTA